MSEAKPPTRSMKEALLAEMFADLNLSIEKLEAIKQWLEDFDDRLMDIVQESSTEVSNSLYDAVRLDIEKAGQLLQQSGTGLKENLEILHRMGHTIQKMTVSVDQIQKERKLTLGYIFVASFGGCLLALGVSAMLF